MSIKASVGQYLVAAAVFSVLDLVWLGLVARELYRDLLGDLVAQNANRTAAVLFYAIFIGGLVYFVIGPAVAEGSWTRALIAGAAFGFVTYATWDLTNLAVIEGFPVAIVPIDMTWGTVLASSVSVATYHLWNLLAS